MDNLLNADIFFLLLPLIILVSQVVIWLYRKKYQAIIATCIFLIIFFEIIFFTEKIFSVLLLPYVLPALLLGLLTSSALFSINLISRFLFSLFILFGSLQMSAWNISFIYSYIIAIFAVLLHGIIENHYLLSARVTELISSNLEFRRQLMHLSVTLALAGLIFFNFLNLFSVIFITFLGLTLSLFAKKRRLPVISHLLDTFERPQAGKKLPGRGVIFLFVSSSFLLFFFPLKIIFFALIITAVGDAISPIIGILFGRKKLPWNRQKHWEGLLMSNIVTTLVLIWGMEFAPAFICSAITMFAESLSLKIWDREIDDNIVVPLTAAISLSVFS